VHAARTWAALFDLFYELLKADSGRFKVVLCSEGFAHRMTLSTMYVWNIRQCSLTKKLQNVDSVIVSTIQVFFGQTA
jgi:hypothetical protein